MRRIAILEYKVGNIHSVRRALAEYDVEVCVTSSAHEIERAHALVLPGVGAFRPAMAALGHEGLADAVRRFVAAGRPTLAICLGLQLLADESEEGATEGACGIAGLGIIRGHVRRLQPGTGMKVPHIGWNAIAPNGAAKVRNGHVASGWFYFAHSFVLQPRDSGIVAAECQYGADRFCSVIEAENVTGVQFHPELSGDAGHELFTNFIAAI